MSYDTRAGSINQTASPTRHTLSSQVSALDEHLSLASELAHRLGKIADALFGAVPTQIQEKSSVAPPEPGPITLALERKHSQFSDVLQRISSEVQRLEERVN
jgi:hypothetical protein